LVNAGFAVPDGVDGGSSIGAAFEQASIPDDVRAPSSQAYAGLGGPQAVLDAVRRCWGSPRTGRAIAYRRRLGIDNSEVAIAVAVQRMVQAEFAG
jgi:phosphoenolpyruvate synthase/pyruvate phosphate dikinase